MPEEEETDVLQPEEDHALVLVGHEGPEVRAFALQTSESLTYDDVPAALLFFFHLVLYVKRHVFVVLKLSVVLLLYSDLLKHDNALLAEEGLCTYCRLLCRSARTGSSGLLACR